MQSLLTVEQLAQHLHKSVASIRSDATRNPQSLPPICRLPGTKRLLWRIEDVENWLAQHVATSVGKTPSALAVAQPCPRGRPTKTAQVEKRRRQNAGTGDSKTLAHKE